MATTGTNFRLEVSFGDASFVCEGQPKQVMDAYSVFREDALAPSASTTRTQPEAKQKTESTRVKGSDGQRSPLPMFLKAHPPKTNDQAVAVLAAWATEHDGATEITTKLVEELWRKSGRKKAGNLGRDIGNAVKQGWLDEVSRGKWTMPDYGLNYVRDLAPKE
jgi:hypothetical protein